jgi:FkbM family methyltransferase
MLKEIFIDESYKFKSKNESVIYDIGANIGVSTLFFRLNYPNAKIIAFEADKNIYEILKNNLKAYNNIEIINKAAWIENRIVSFDNEGSDSGKIDNNGDKKVEAIRLLEFLEKEEKINLLKMDIEGAETEVFMDIKYQLNKIDNIIMEYHYKNNSEDKLIEILTILKQNNFKYYLETINSRPAPLYNDSNNNFFSQINIYATKKDY